MSAHQGMQNNGWETVGNIVAKAPWGIVFTRKPNMHIPLCSGQKLSNQCYCMGDNSINSQMCCQAFNGCELENTIASTYRAHLDVEGGKSNRFSDKHCRYMNTIL